jgi:hypothetical protein
MTWLRVGCAACVGPGACEEPGVLLVPLRDAAEGDGAAVAGRLRRGVGPGACEEPGVLLIPLRDAAEGDGAAVDVVQVGAGGGHPASMQRATDRTGEARTAVSVGLQRHAQPVGQGQ